MAAGSGTTSYPTAAGDSVFGDAAGSLVSIALGLATGSDIKQLDDFVKMLWRASNFLASKFAEFAIAELWWAAHIGTATSELVYYLEQAAGHLQVAEQDNLDAWTRFLTDKYPADLKALYDDLSGKIPKVQKVNLKPIEAAIKALQADDESEKKWQSNTADPKLSAWSKFYATWTTTYLPPARTLIDWLKHPAHLADFALPSIVAGMPSALSAKAASASTIAIETALLSTWSRNADQVYNLLLAWATTDS